jgi:hypothetical protein
MNISENRQQNVSGSAKIRMPEFIIIGEMRCGSTTLWEMLDRHPSLGFPEEKELHFFDDRDGRWSRGPDWYSNLFKQIPDGSLCGEATPDYLFHDGACERIASAIPDVRLVVILRDPKQRAWSHYWHNIRRGRETLAFGEALEAEAARMQDPDVSIRSHFSYVTRGHYVRRLQHFARFFGRDALCVVFLEELIARPAETMREVCLHIGVDPLAEVLGSMPPQRNKADYPRWPVFSALTHRMMKSLEGNSLLSMPARAFAAATRSLRTYSGQPRMDAATCDWMRDIYRPSDAALEEWLGREIPWSRISSKNAQKTL